MFPEADGKTATTTAESMWYQKIFNDSFPGCKGSFRTSGFLALWAKTSISARVLTNYAE